MSIPPNPRKLRPEAPRETTLEWPGAQACAHIALISLTISALVAGPDKGPWLKVTTRWNAYSWIALTAGIDPQQFTDWMARVFIDAADWVMVPNVVGMALHADGGRMATKPYASGGAYIDKMSDYCSGCHYDRTKRVGDDACPFTTLYWDFLLRHEKVLRANQRMALQVKNVDRLNTAQRADIRARAASIRTTSGARRTACTDRRPLALHHA